MPFPRLQLPTPPPIKLRDMIFKLPQNRISRNHYRVHPLYCVQVCRDMPHIHGGAALAFSLMRPYVMVTGLKWPLCYLKNVVTYGHNNIGSSP